MIGEFPTFETLPDGETPPEITEEQILEALRHGRRAAQDLLNEYLVDLPPESWALILR